MKPIHLCLLIIAGLLIGAIAADRTTAQQPPLAQQPGRVVALPPQTRVAVCDVVEIFDTCNKSKRLSKQFEGELKGIEEAVAEKDTGIADLAKQLKNPDLVRGGPAHEDLVKKHGWAVLQRGVFIKFQQADMFRRRHQLTLDMYRDILKVIEETAVKKNVRIVLFRERREIKAKDMQELMTKIASRKVLYWDKAVDLTPEVLLEINKRFK